MNDLISVIVPVYNVEKYLEQCVDSIINQTYTNLEIILVDDGSTDNSGKICDKYAAMDSRIKVVHKINSGVSTARNLGLDIAKGEYITFIDSDDFVEEDYIFALYNNLIENDSDMSMCNMVCFGENWKRNLRELLPNCVRVDMESNEFINYFVRYISYKNYIFGSVWRVLYKSSIIKNIRFNEEIKISEDLLFLLQVILNSKKITSIDTYLYYYREVESSVRHSYKKNYLDGQIKLYHELKKIVGVLNNKKISKIFRTYCAILSYYLFSNEFKFVQNNRRHNINEIKKSELYAYFKLFYGLKIDGVFYKIKFLIVWLWVKLKRF